MLNIFYLPTSVFNAAYKLGAVDKIDGIWFKFLSTNFAVKASGFDVIKCS